MNMCILNRVPTTDVSKTPFELFKGFKTNLGDMCIWGYLYKVRVYNPQQKKLDPRTISGYFIGYAKKSKGYRFYCPSHKTRMMESRNKMFLENDLINGSNQIKNLVSMHDHIEYQPSNPGDRLFIIHN